MVDNFNLIRPLFYFNESNNMFFHCQIVTRAKDHKGEDKKIKEGAIKAYFIRSKEQLEALKDEIILLCEHYGARAYINVSGKDFNKVNKLMLQKLAIYNLNDDINNINPRKILNSAAGEIISRCKKWVIDVDDVSQSNDILKWLDKYFNVVIKMDDYQKLDRFKYLYATIPTKNGLHFITKPFNVEVFNIKFPNVAIHKNSMGTLLYCPKSVD